MSASLISHTWETHCGLSLLTNVSERTTPDLGDRWSALDPNATELNPYLRVLAAICSNRWIILFVLRI
jgi:hypothetical protein